MSNRSDKIKQLAKTVSDDMSIDGMTFFFYLLARQGNNFPWEPFFFRFVTIAKEQGRLVDIVKCAKMLIEQAEAIDG